jgi:hypothetical protein
MPDVFDSDDSVYLAWLTAHPDGFVINTRRRSDPEYIVLHRATCRTISRPTAITRPGGFTERSYIKICAGSVEELRRWARGSGRPDGSFSKACGLCRPL